MLSQISKTRISDSWIPRQVRPSTMLRELARRYLRMVDRAEATGENNADENGMPFKVHHDLMEAMEQEGIPFNSGTQARWIARWLNSGVPLADGKLTTIMFAKRPEYRKESEYDPICNGVRELYKTPFTDLEDEQKNAARFIPVLVTVEPLRDYAGATYNRNTQRQV